MIGWGEGRRPKRLSALERWAWRIAGALVTWVIWVYLQR